MACRAEAVGDCALMKGITVSVKGRCDSKAEEVLHKLLISLHTRWQFCFDSSQTKGMKRVDHPVCRGSISAILTVLAFIQLLGAEKKESTASLQDARRGFATQLVRKQKADEPVPDPPPRLFRVVKYDSLAGKLAAYVSPSPQDGKKHLAVIWLFGGFSNSIGETAWEQGPPENDQSASAFREAGIIMMYPSLRGGNKNPGFIEGYYGEVDDVLSAAQYLAKQDYYYPKLI
jgi:hypothetical protein